VKPDKVFYTNVRTEKKKKRIDESPNGILLHLGASLMIFIDQESTTIGIVMRKRKAVASS